MYWRSSPKPAASSEGHWEPLFCKTNWCKPDGSEILKVISEPAFIDDSYGFRPGRSCHDALRETGLLDQIPYIN